MDNVENKFEKTKGKLIVSCQALPDEPLHSSFIMGRMAIAAKQAGASGIRANGIEDIQEIKRQVDLPIIGIVKADYDNSKVFITPTMKEVDALYKVGVDVIAMDATNQIRPDDTTINTLFPKIRKKYPNQLFMADCSTYDEGIQAGNLGFDFVGTTLNGYTSYTKGSTIPNFDLIKTLVKDCSAPIIAEGGIWTPEQLKEMYSYNIYTAVVGSAITRPQEITKQFVKVIE